jgi:threonine dehydratase
VVAASGGNHGAAVAFAARRRGVPATIFVPLLSTPAKVARIRDSGARLIISGDSYSDALAECETWTASHDVMPIHAFDQTETLCGQGTIALELERQVGEIDTVIAPVGGGGLFGGIAAWFGTRVRLIGVEPELCPTLTRAIEAGHPVDAPVGGIAADALGPRRVGEMTYAIIAPVLHRTVLVSDDSIRAAQQHLWQHMRLLVEPAGATPVAALLSGAYTPAPDERVALILSGGNTVVDSATLTPSTS